MKVKLIGQVISIMYVKNEYQKCIEFHAVIVDEDTMLKYFVKCRKENEESFLQTINIGDVIKIKGVTVRHEHKYGEYIVSKNVKKLKEAMNEYIFS